MRNSRLFQVVSCLIIGGLLIFSVEHTFLHFSSTYHQKVNTTPMSPIWNSKSERISPTEARVLRWNGKSWKRIPNFCNGTNNFPKVTLKSRAGETPIYIHDTSVDRHISGSLRRIGLWEDPFVDLIIDRLRSDPEMGLIDLGSHVGVFSLVAAKLGHQAVAVDPLVENVLRLCKSVQDGHLSDKVTIVFTAVSNNYRKVRINREKTNLGGTRIVDAPSNTDISGDYDPNIIDTVLLDDILPAISFKKAFLKIDVEEHEYHVVSGALKFFETIDVRAILMEWLFQKSGPDGEKLKDLLLKKNYKPIVPVANKPLKGDTYRQWTNEVLWLKND